MRINEVFLPFDLEEDLQGPQQKRAEFIKKTFEPRWNGVPGYEDLDAFIERLAEVDPSANGQYMPWMAKLIIQNPDDNKPEDLQRVAGDLRNWERFKSQLAVKDINAYKSFRAVYDAIAPYLAPRKKTKDELAKEREAAKLAKLREQIQTVYNGPEGWIRIPLSQEAACYLGQQTRWCTAARKSNMFDHYNNSDRMFVVYDKASKERFQLHIASGQFADASDKMLGMKAVPEWSRDHIINWYRENNPSLSLTQLLALNTFKKDATPELAKGTVHADLLDLMSKYGI